MTDQWTPVGPLVPDNEWGSTCGCAPEGGPSSADSVVITGSPGAVTSILNGNPLWSIVLNDGTPAADFRIDRFDNTGALVDSPMTIVRATGVVSFHDPVMLAADPAQPLEAVTKHYVDVNAAGVVDAPTDGTFYGRKSAAWSNPTHLDITDWAATLAAYYLASNPSGYQTAAQVTASLGPYALTSSVPVASSTPPLMDGTAAVGTGATWARADHVHPTDTSRYAASNPSGFQTAAQVTAVLPVASATVPLPSGIAAIGTSAAYARADHVHPTPIDVYSHSNRIINGDMLRDQRLNGASTFNPAGTGYAVDRWQMNSAAFNIFNYGQNLGAPAMPPGFPYCLGFVASSTFTLASGDFYSVGQPIEADMLSDLAFGTANAQPVTASFLVRASFAGSYSGSLRNYAGTRSYPFSFSIPTANTWTPIAVTIPGDTAGAWVLSGNGGGARLTFDLGQGPGSPFRGPANAWAAANYMGVTGAANMAGTNARGLWYSAVKFEIGSVATPFNRETVAKLLADCQRYYFQPAALLLANGYQAAAGQVHNSVYLPVAMRIAPTVTPSNQTYNNASALAINNVDLSFYRTTLTITAAGYGYCNYNSNFNAEL